MRKKVFDIIEPVNKDTALSRVYDFFMIVVIIASVIPLAFKVPHPLFNTINQVTAYIFIADYALRLATADYKLKKGAVSFLLYPFTPMAIIDLLAILPSFTSFFFHAFRLVKLFRLFRALRVFRSFKLFRYTKSLRIITDVIKAQKGPLLAVTSLAVGYILISALVVFNVEPASFSSFFDAVYWATVSLTTVGYGDIYPVTAAGRVVTMISSFVGVAVVALPAGIITAGYMDELRQIHKKERHKDK